MIEIRQAVYEDIPNIMRFMDEHWKPGNILAKNRDFFEWQFVDGDKVNMFIGVDAHGKIYGMIGAIIYSGSSNPDVSACTWQTIKSCNPMLGLELSDYLVKHLHPRYTCSAGLSKKSVKIHELTGGTPISMDHYYRLGDREDYKIAKVKDKIILQVEDSGYRLEPIYCLEEMKQIITEEMLANSVMSKDYEYIKKRYFEHPIYHYDIWKILNNEKKSSSVLMTREEMVEDRKICKIIDFYGCLSDLGKITASFDDLMAERGYEFIDVYSYGVPTLLYEQAGFCRCDEACENIIPNYFHPFEQRNVVLNMMDPMISEMRMFRGDGDQDRPC